MRRIFVSGCFDVLHAGHIAFLREAKSLGDHLTVSIAADDVIRLAKSREPSVPLDSRIAIMQAVRYVDDVIVSGRTEPVLDFADNLILCRPDVLAVTDDDQHIEAKQKLCSEWGIKLVVLPKRGDGTSSSSIVRAIKGKSKVPLRVDFAGGWLDVPKFARPGGYIVNCAIEPLVSLDDWPYQIGSGLGGSAAKSILELKDGVTAELAAGVGWQDAAVIEETGLCVWRSGDKPVLEAKYNPDWLRGKMLLYWTGKPHMCANLVDNRRDYMSIVKASQFAMRAAELKDAQMLGNAIAKSAHLQLLEGMSPAAHGIPWKYCGGGWGGYRLLLFADECARDAAHGTATIRIEPYLK